MSTDYMVACRSCEVRRHFGQDMGGKTSLGYGSNDVEGAQAVLAFVFKHAECDDRVVVLLSDTNFHEPEYEFKDEDE